MRDFIFQHHAAIGGSMAIVAATAIIYLHTKARILAADCDALIEQAEQLDERCSELLANHQKLTQMINLRMAQEQVASGIAAMHLPCTVAKIGTQKRQKQQQPATSQQRDSHGRFTIKM